MNNGNVGIGTTDPTATLDVNGNFNVVSNSTQQFWTGVFTNSALNTSTYPSSAIAIGKDLSFNTAGEVKFTISDNPNTDNMLSLGFTYNGDILKVKANRTVEIDGNFNVVCGSQLTTPAATIKLDAGTAANFENWQHTAQLQIQNNSNNSSLVLAMSTDGVGIIQGKTVNVGYNNVVLNPIAGNVGIGTTNPSYNLDIKGNSGTLLRLQNNTPLYEGGQSNIEFWTGTSNYPLGMIKTTDVGNGPSGSFRSSMKFYINDNSTSIAGTLPLKLALTLDHDGVDVNGTITATIFNATSDLRLKDNINDLSNSLEKICAMRGVEYTWKGDDTKKLQCGVIAQEVNMIIPEAVNTSNPDTMTVNYNAIIGHLIESIKTLKQEVDNLKSQLPQV
jgi:hypothetical protein